MAAKKQWTKKDSMDAGLSLLGYGAGAALAYALFKPKDKPSPIAPGTGTAGFGAAPKGFFPTRRDIAATLQRVGRDLGDYFNQASRLAGVPAWLIQAIVANEIGFAKYTTVNPAVKATGPGQITPPTAFAVYYIASVWGLITPEMDALFARKLGSQYGTFKAIAMQGRASASLIAPKLLDLEFNVAMSGLLLRCLTHLFNDGSNANAGRVVLGYNRGIDWSLNALRRPMGISRAKLISLASKPGWRMPARLNITPQETQLQAPGPEGRNYVANHLAPGGYFETAVKLGLAPSASV